MTLWERYARMGPARAAIVTAVALALAALAYTTLGALRIDTSLEALLPLDTPARRALDALRERVASDATFTVLVTSDDEALNRRLSHEVAEGIATWEETDWVTDRRDIDTLTDAAALYLDSESLEELADDMQARVEWEYCERMPGCVNFFDQPELPEREELVDKLAESPSGKALSTYAGRDLVEIWKERDAQRSGDGAQKDEGRLCSEDGQVCAVQAALKGSASDLEFSRVVRGKADALFAQLRPDDAPESLQMVVSGRYRNAPMEREAINADLARTTWVSCTLIVALLLAQFRGLRALVLLLVPLVVAILGTLGVLAAVHPRLNLISAFTLAILAGVGVDFGIHLLTHYGDRRTHGEQVSGALGHTLKSLFGSLLAAGATTGAAFAALSASDFRGIAEMGWMAGMGVILSLLAFMLLFPAITTLAHRVWPERGAISRGNWLAALPQPSPRGARTVAALGVLVGLASAALATGVRLETDFRRLQTPEISHGIPSAGALRGTAGLSVYMLAQKPEQLAAATDDLVERQFDHIAGDEGVLVLSPSVLLPTDQKARLASLESIRASVAKLQKRADEDEKAQLDELARWVDVHAPLSAQSLPVNVRASLSEKDGSFGRLGVAYLPMRGYDAGRMEELSHQLDAWRQRYEGVTFASPSAMLGEVVPALRADALTIVGLALLGLTLASAAFGRSLKRTALVLAPVLLSMVAAAACMAVWDMRINLYNVLVLPVAFGVGVDGAVYVVWATADAPDRAAFWERYKVAAQAVLGSSLTSLVAFGSISLAHNPGLASLGKLAILTIALALVANLVWLPCWLLAGNPKQPQPQP